MPDEDKNAALMREMLQQSQKATQDLIAALPGMLAMALAGAQAPGGAAGGAVGGAAAGDDAGNAALLQPSARNLRDRKVPDFWDESPKAWFKIFDDHLSLIHI